MSILSRACIGNVLEIFGMTMVEIYYRLRSEDKKMIRGNSVGHLKGLEEKKKI